MRIRVLKADQPDIRPNSESGDSRYILNEDYIFTLSIDDKRHSFKIPKGFEYDGASVPNLFMFLIGFERDGVHRPAALIHDFLYVSVGSIKNVHKKSFQVTRKDADRIFLKVMEHVGVKSWHGRLGYWAVRGFGWMFERF